MQTTPVTAPSRKAFSLPPFLPFPPQHPFIKPARPVTGPALPSPAAVPPGGLADPAAPGWTLSPPATPWPSVWLSGAHLALVTCSQGTPAKHTLGVLPAREPTVHQLLWSKLQTSLAASLEANALFGKRLLERARGFFVLMTLKFISM